jgi:hypothetical protein
MPDGWPDAARFADLVGGVIARAAAAADVPPKVAIVGAMRNPKMAKSVE